MFRNCPPCVSICQVFEFDTTIGGQVAPSATERVISKYTDGGGALHDVVDGRMELSLLFLKTYENIGSAQVARVQGPPQAGMAGG